MDLVLSHMRPTIRTTLFLLLAFSASSCWVLMPNCPRQFNVHEEPITSLAPVMRLRMDGIYVCEETGTAFCIWPSGLVKEYPVSIPSTGFWANPQETLDRIAVQESYRSKDDWGAYSLQGTALKIQTFNYHQTEFCKRSVFEYTGAVENDTTFVITSKIAYWFADTATTGRFVYRFYPTDLRPDDSRIWFEKKRWYKRERHADRVR